MSVLYCKCEVQKNVAPIRELLELFVLYASVHWQAFGVCARVAFGARRGEAPRCALCVPFLLNSVLFDLSRRAPRRLTNYYKCCICKCTGLYCTVVQSVHCRVLVCDKSASVWSDLTWAILRVYSERLLAHQSSHHSSPISHHSVCHHLIHLVASHCVTSPVLCARVYCTSVLYSVYGISACNCLSNSPHHFAPKYTLLNIHIIVRMYSTVQYMYSISLVTCLVSSRVATFVIASSYFAHRESLTRSCSSRESPQISAVIPARFFEEADEEVSCPLVSPRQ